MVDNEGIKRLANAIIERACEDYVSGYRYGRGYYDGAELELFFKSDWFILLSRGCVSGETVLRHLEKERLNHVKELLQTKEF